MRKDLCDMTDEELIREYSEIPKELKRRKIIRTKNVIGELGETQIIATYNKDKTLPNLTLAPVSAENIDAIDEQGNRYAIKSITRNVTGVFHGLVPKENTNLSERLFDYAVICKFDKFMAPLLIIQIDWDTFLKHKKWHSRMQAWNLTLTKSLIQDSKIILDKRN